MFLKSQLKSKIEHVYLKKDAYKLCNMETREQFCLLHHNYHHKVTQLIFFAVLSLNLEAKRCSAWKTWWSDQMRPLYLGILWRWSSRYNQSEHCLSVSVKWVVVYQWSLPSLGLPCVRVHHIIRENSDSKTW